MITVGDNFAFCHFILTETEGRQSNTPCGEELFRTVNSILSLPPCTGLTSLNASLLTTFPNGTNGQLKHMGISMVTSVIAFQSQCNRSGPCKRGEITSATRSWHSKRARLSRLSLSKRGLHQRQISQLISILMRHCGKALQSRLSTGLQRHLRRCVGPGLTNRLLQWKLIFAPVFSRSASGLRRRDFGIGLDARLSEMPSRRQQAKEGDTQIGSEATYVHGEQAAGEVAKDVQDAIKEMVTFNLMPATTLALRFTGNSFPGIANPQILSAEAMFWSLGEAKMKHLLDDLSLQTAVEAGDGHFPAVVPHRREGRLSTPAQLAAIFDESIMPAALQQSTRNSYFASWKVVLSWGIAHDEVKLLLPMSRDTLKAITQELLMVGCSAGSIRNIWSAIEDRHRRFGYAPPLGMEGDFSRMARAVGSVRGQPSRLIFPIGVHHVQRLMELIGLTLTQKRDMLACVLGTVACLRVGEVENLQLCDLKWGHDAAWHADYEGSMAIGIYKRKQDQVRKGLFPRVGSAVTSRVRAFVEELGLETSEECSKGRAPGARCRTCPPVFPRTVNGVDHSRPVSRQQVTNAVINSLRMLEVDTTHFSGLSMRRGGISAALVARVPEPILFLQSGHGSNNAARNYMVPRNPHILFETYNAFGI